LGLRLLVQQADGRSEDGIEVREELALAVHQSEDAGGSTTDDLDGADDGAGLDHSFLQMQKAVRLPLSGPPDGLGLEHR
jgi:hypothetical protein